MEPGPVQMMLDPVEEFSNAGEALRPIAPAAVACLDSDRQAEIVAGFDCHHFACRSRNRVRDQIAAGHRTRAGYRNYPSCQKTDKIRTAGREGPAAGAGSRIGVLAVPPYLPGSSQIADH